MAEEEDEDSKEFEPSQRRLQQAREEGDVVRSDDLQAAAAQAGFLLAIIAFGAWAVARSGEAGLYLLSRPDTLSIAGDRPGDEPWSSVLAMIGPAALLLGAPALAVLVWLFGSRSLVFAGSKLELRWSRLSILENARQKFGRTGLIDFAKKSFKTVAIATTLVLFLQGAADILFLSARQDPGAVALTMVRMIVSFLLIGVALTLIFGVADYLLQRADHLRRNRMTRKQMTDELKESEGDPHLKADRRRRAQEIANRRMMADVPTADVVIVNPEHYAVALKWNRETGRAPICVAKGLDEVALRIKALAAESGVPIRRDPPTARLLYSVVDLGEEIRPEHYAAVAAAIRFADAMRKRARRGWRRS